MDRCEMAEALLASGADLNAENKVIHLCSLSLPRHCLLNCHFVVVPLPFPLCLLRLVRHIDQKYGLMPYFWHDQNNFCMFPYEVVVMPDFWPETRPENQKSGCEERVLAALACVGFLIGSLMPAPT